MLSRIDFLVIQNRGDDVKCDAGGPSTDRGKFVAWINLYNYGEYHRPVINTNDIFDSAEQAKSWAERFVLAVRTGPDVELFQGDIPAEKWAEMEKLMDEVVTLEQALAEKDKIRIQMNRLQKALGEVCATIVELKKESVALERDIKELQKNCPHDWQKIVKWKRGMPVKMHTRVCSICGQKKVRKIAISGWFHPIM